MKKHLDAIGLGALLAIVFVASKIGLVYFEGHILAFIACIMIDYGFYVGSWEVYKHFKYKGYDKNNRK